MVDLSSKVPFSCVLITVGAICLVIAVGILLVNRRTKKMKGKY